jgi:hypothetical protein
VTPGRRFIPAVAEQGSRSPNAIDVGRPGFCLQGSGRECVGAGSRRAAGGREMRRELTAAKRRVYGVREPSSAVQRAESGQVGRGCVVGAVVRPALRSARERALTAQRFGAFVATAQIELGYVESVISVPRSGVCEGQDLDVLTVVANRLPQPLRTTSHHLTPPPRSVERRCGVIDWKNFKARVQANSVDVFDHRAEQTTPDALTPSLQPDEQGADPGELVDVASVRSCTCPVHLGGVGKVVVGRSDAADMAHGTSLQFGRPRGDRVVCVHELLNRDREGPSERVLAGCLLRPEHVHQCRDVSGTA